MLASRCFLMLGLLAASRMHFACAIQGSCLQPECESDARRAGFSEENPLNPQIQKACVCPKPFCRVNRGCEVRAGFLECLSLVWAPSRPHRDRRGYNKDTPIIQLLKARRCYVRRGLRGFDLHLIAFHTSLMSLLAQLPDDL